MSFFDSAKDKLSKLAAEHPDQVEQLSDQAIEHGGDAADRMRGGTNPGLVDSAQATADEAIGEP